MASMQEERPAFKEDEIIGFQVHELSKRMKEYVQNKCVEDGVDPVAATHGWLIGYLYANQDQELYQRDLEDKMHLAKSSIANILQTLEQAGYIRRETPEHDARQKRILLTPEGCEFELRMRQRLTSSEMQARTGISEEDQQVFLRVLRQMISNMS